MPENYAVIVENDISAWADETGVLYHFPKRYLELLNPNTRVIYYKGKIKDKSFSQSRLTDEPHYFGEALLGERYQDRNSGKGDWFITIKEFYPFSAPVLARQSDGYLEIIPKAREKTIGGTEFARFRKLSTTPFLISPLNLTSLKSRSNLDCWMMKRLPLSLGLRENKQKNT